MGQPLAASSFFKGAIFFLSVSRNSTLCLLVKRRYPSLNLSAISQTSLMKSMLTSLPEPILTE